MLLRKNSWIVGAFLLSGCGGGLDELVQRQLEATQQAVTQLRLIKDDKSLDWALQKLDPLFTKIGEEREKLARLNPAQVNRLNALPEMQQLAKATDQMDEALVDACRRIPDREEELKELFKKTGRQFRPKK